MYSQRLTGTVDYSKLLKNTPRTIKLYLFCTHYEFLSNPSREGSEHAKPEKSHPPDGQGREPSGEITVQSRSLIWGSLRKLNADRPAGKIDESCEEDFPGMLALEGLDRRPRVRTFPGLRKRQTQNCLSPPLALRTARGENS